MKLTRLSTLALAIFAGVTIEAPAHEGPDPIAHWSFNSRSVAEGVCKARLGADLRLDGDYALATDAHGEALDLTGTHTPTSVGASGP